MMAPTGEFQIHVDAEAVAGASGALTIDPRDVEHPPELRIVGIDRSEVRLELRPL